MIVSRVIPRSILLVLLAAFLLIPLPIIQAQSPLPTPTPTELPEDRGWFNASPGMPNPAPFVHPAPPDISVSSASGAWVPEVYDTSGLQQSWDWIHSHYGNTNYAPTDGQPQFILRRVDSTVGPATITVRVVDKNGFPVYNQPVALSWPGIDCSHPDPNIKPLSGSKTLIATCGIMQRTDTNGYTGYGMSGDWYYRNGSAPGIVWVLSPSTYSWGATGIGMLGGTNHEGPLSYTFQESSGTPPTSTPVLPTPVPGVTPTPGPTPPAGAYDQANYELLQQLLATLKELSSHLGVQP